MKFTKGVCSEWQYMYMYLQNSTKYDQLYKNMSSMIF